MLDDSVQSLPAPVARFIRAIAAMEDWVGLIFEIILIVMFGGLIVFVAQDAGINKSLAWRLGWIVAGVLWLALDVPHLWRLAVVAHQHRKPFAVHAAARQKLPPLFLRPVIGIWWLAHFAAGIGIAVSTHFMRMQTEARGDRILIFFMVVFYGYAANGFLLLGVYALTSSKIIRQTIWRFRAVTDISLALLCLGLWR